MQGGLRLALICLAALAPVTAAAQSDAAKALAGPWEISNADHDKICAVTLRAEPTSGGLKFDFDRAACGTNFPPLKEAAAWDLIGDNVVRVVGAKGKVLYEFTEVEAGTYEFAAARPAADVPAERCRRRAAAAHRRADDRRLERRARSKRTELHVDPHSDRGWQRRIRPQGAAWLRPGGGRLWSGVMAYGSRGPVFEVGTGTELALRGQRWHLATRAGRQGPDHAGAARVC